MPQHKPKQVSDRLRTRNPGHAIKRNAGKIRKGGSGWINPKSEQGRRKAKVGFLNAIPKITRDTESITAGKLAMTGGRFRLKGMQATAKEQLRLIRQAGKQKEIVRKNSNHKRGTTRRDDVDDEEIDFVFKSMGVVRDPEMEAIRAKKRAQRKGAAASGELGGEAKAALLGQSAMDELDKIIESGSKVKGVASPGAGLLPSTALEEEAGMGAEGTAALLEKVERRMRAEAKVRGTKSTTAVALAAQLEAEREMERRKTGGGAAAAGKGQQPMGGGGSSRGRRKAAAGPEIVDASASGGSAFSFGF